MSIEIKLGQWYKDSCGYLAQVTAIYQFLDKETQYNLTFSNRTVPVWLSSFSNFTYIPNCTGYDWKPLEIPEGYRKLEIGEVPVEGDLWSQDGFKPFETLNQASYMVYTKKQIPPMNERVPRGKGCGEYDPGAIWARKVEKWVPYTFENFPNSLKVMSKHSKRKYVVNLIDENNVSICSTYISFQTLFNSYTDLNGGPLGTKV